MSFFGIIMVIAGLFSAVFWMFMGWRAVMAHERLADAAEKMASKLYAEGEARNE